jgi:hypothetical protein
MKSMLYGLQTQLIFTYFFKNKKIMARFWKLRHQVPKNTVI